MSRRTRKPSLSLAPPSERPDAELDDELLHYDGNTLAVDVESATMATNVGEIEALAAVSELLSRRAA